MNQNAADQNSPLSRIMDQYWQSGRRFYLKFQAVPAPEAKPDDDPFNRWLHDDHIVNIDWNNFGLGSDH